MADEHKNRQERRVSLDDLPDEVRQLADAMIGVNPQWNVHDWLVEQANMTMDLLAIDLLREKVMIDQRLQRLDDLGRRLEPHDAAGGEEEDPHQRNLFDCFDLNEPHALRGLGERATEPLSHTNEGEEQHPSNIFLDLLPEANTDDPLLAIACQSVVMSIEQALASGEPVATLEAIFNHTRSSSIEDHETDEALDHCSAPVWSWKLTTIASSSFPNDGTPRQSRRPILWTSSHVTTWASYVRFFGEVWHGFRQQR